MVIGAGVSWFGQRKAQKRADKQFEEQKRLAEQDFALRQEGLDFSKSQYADWKSKYDPVYGKVMENIESDIEPDYNAIASDTKQAFESSRGANQRNMLRYGIRPQDGNFAHADRESRLAEGAAHVGTRNQARQASKGLKYARYADLHNSLKGIGTNLASNVMGGYNAAGNAAGRMGDMYGQRGIQAWNSGMANASGWGNFIGNTDWGKIWGDIRGMGGTLSHGEYTNPNGSGMQGPPSG
jgi:hypothetical protein